MVPLHAGCVPLSVAPLEKPQTSTGRARRASVRQATRIELCCDLGGRRAADMTYYASVIRFRNGVYQVY